MLVLMRKPGEEIVLFTSDGPVTIQLVSTVNGRAKIGFEAPPAVKIYRREVLDRPDFNPGVQPAN